MSTRSPAAENQESMPDWLREELRARLERDLRLPVLPDTACRVMAACQDEHTELRELAALVTNDQSLAAHVLRVANSVAYAPKAPILSLRQAIGRLGLSTVSDIAIAVAIKQRVFTVPGHEERIRALWLHSAASANYAQQIARLLQHNVDTAFLCGLLHDVGMPIVMQAVCDLVKEHEVEPVSGAQMEAAMLEFHGAFGAKIAECWRLGPWVRAAIAHHHDPTGAGLLREDVLVTTLADALADWAVDDSLDAQAFSLEGCDGIAPSLRAEDLLALLGSRERVVELASAFQ